MKYLLVLVYIVPFSLFSQWETAYQLKDKLEDLSFSAFNSYYKKLNKDSLSQESILFFETYIYYCHDEMEKADSTAIAYFNLINLSTPNFIEDHLFSKNLCFLMLEHYFFLRKKKKYKMWQSIYKKKTLQARCGNSNLQHYIVCTLIISNKIAYQNLKGNKMKEINQRFKNLSRRKYFGKVLSYSKYR